MGNFLDMFSSRDSQMKEIAACKQESRNVAGEAARAMSRPRILRTLAETLDRAMVSHEVILDRANDVLRALGSLPDDNPKKVAAWRLVYELESTQTYLNQSRAICGLLIMNQQTISTKQLFDTRSASEVMIYPTTAAAEARASLPPSSSTKLYTAAESLRHQVALSNATQFGAVTRNLELRVKHLDRLGEQLEEACGKLANIRGSSQPPHVVAEAEARAQKAADNYATFHKALKADQGAMSKMVDNNQLGIRLDTTKFNGVSKRIDEIHRAAGLDMQSVGIIAVIKPQEASQQQQVAASAAPRAAQPSVSPQPPMRQQLPPQQQQVAASPAPRAVQPQPSPQQPMMHQQQAVANAAQRPARTPQPLWQQQQQMQQQGQHSPARSAVPEHFMPKFVAGVGEVSPSGLAKPASGRPLPGQGGLQYSALPEKEVARPLTPAEQMQLKISEKRAMIGAKTQKQEPSDKPAPSRPGLGNGGS